ncbi:MAG: DNA primase [Hornefia sp.]|nr:DNA primase [Hornefia sp.]
MGFSISQSSIENLKNQIDIVDVIGQVVQLKRAGSNHKGICPFHNEKTPSFVVSEQKQYFTCFGCGASGDVIEFVKRYYNMDFSEACEKIADEYGITLEKNGGYDNRNEYYEINRLAAQFFYDSFTKKANKGYSYMKSRGISSSILKKFGIGYADKEWDSLYRHLKSKGIEEKKMQELGLISNSKGKYYDRFRNRVMFPIINTSGKVIGFGGRAIDDGDEPKYLNSPESGIFQKKNNLYGLNISRQAAGKQGKIILVEGYMDVISLFQSGIENVAASLGTALTENQAKLLNRYVKEVVLSYDSDSAGRKAALRGIEILRNENSKVKVLHVTDGKDPDDYVKKNGKKAFLNLVDGALPYGDYKLQSAMLGYDLSSDEDRLEYLQKAVTIISKMSPLEQEIYTKKISEELGIARSALDRELYRKTKPTEHKVNKRKESEEAEKGAIELSSLERTLIKLAFSEEAYIDKIFFEPELIQSGFCYKILSATRESISEHNFFKIENILPHFSDGELELLREVIDNTLIDSNHEDVFKECVKKNKAQLLAEKEKVLLLKLSMADEESDENSIREITDELMRVQKDKKKFMN